MVSLSGIAECTILKCCILIGAALPFVTAARLKIDSLYISIDLSIVAAAAGGQRNIKSRPLNPRSGGSEISV